jgi:hypothetical protein
MPIPIITEKEQVVLYLTGAYEYLSQEYGDDYLHTQGVKRALDQAQKMLGLYREIARAAGEED